LEVQRLIYSVPNQQLIGEEIYGTDTGIEIFLRKYKFIFSMFNNLTLEGTTNV